MPGAAYLGMPTDVRCFIERRFELGAYDQFWLSYLFRLANASTPGVPLNYTLVGVNPNSNDQFYIAIGMHPAMASAIAIRALYAYQREGQRDAKENGRSMIMFHGPSGQQIDATAEIETEPAVAELLPTQDSPERPSSGSMGQGDNAPPSVKLGDAREDAEILVAIPPLDDSGDWVTNKIAAKVEGVAVGTLTRIFHESA